MMLRPPNLHSLSSSARQCVLLLCTVLLVSLSGVNQASAQWLVTVDGSATLPVSEPASTLFGPGFSLGANAYRDLAPWLLVGMRVEFSLVTDGEPPEDSNRVDPGMSSVFATTLSMRLRPGAFGGSDSLGEGPWLEAGVGGGLTGSVGRPIFAAGLGWAFLVGEYGIGPSIRYTQVIETRDPLDNRDARLLLLGVEGQLLDERAVLEEPDEPEPSDRDADGIIDLEDDCPDVPEDLDGFEDEDGCPDPDNDGDGILDEPDECPNEPEDMDDFEDEDGCPDLDNDDDGFRDVVDECPNDPEVVNGIDDHDGCPDEGQIEFIDDRIVLDERVLFDTDRARVRSAGRSALQALMRLWRQHPEWVEVEIHGHADQRGEEEYNQTLSERRAAEVRRYLIDRGADPESVRAVGFGSTRPRDRRQTEEGYQRNRRVEFVVIRREEVEANTDVIEGENGGAAE